MQPEVDALTDVFLALSDPAMVPFGLGPSPPLRWVKSMVQEQRISMNPKTRWIFTRKKRSKSLRVEKALEEKWRRMTQDQLHKSWLLTIYKGSDELIIDRVTSQPNDPLHKEVRTSVRNFVVRLFCSPPWQSLHAYVQNHQSGFTVVFDSWDFMFVRGNRISINSWAIAAERHDN